MNRLRRLWRVETKAEMDLLADEMARYCEWSTAHISTDWLRTDFPRLVEWLDGRRTERNGEPPS